MLQGSWRQMSSTATGKLDLPSGPQRNAVLKQIASLKRGFLNNPTGAGRIVWKTGDAPVDAAGKRIFGRYNSADNTNRVYKDADLSTLARLFAL